MAIVVALALAFTPVASGSSPAPSLQKCATSEPNAILVCGNGPQPYRIDLDVTARERAAEKDRDSASAKAPAAQAACAQSPMGCAKGLENLDLVNVAVVAGTMAVNAATGQDWAKPLRPAGPGEYQRYREAKAERAERAAERAAQRLRDAARAAAGDD